MRVAEDRADRMASRARIAQAAADRVHKGLSLRCGVGAYGDGEYVRVKAVARDSCNVKECVSMRYAVHMMLQSASL